MPFDASLSERLPTAEEVEQTKKAVGALAHRTDRTGVPSLRLKHDRSSGYVELPPAVGQLVLQLLELISKGEAVELVPVATELSTQQAADLLNMSRPHLVKLLESKVLPHVKVGSHRRIKAEDLFAYKRLRDRQRDAALARMMRLGQEIDAE